MSPFVHFILSIIVVYSMDLKFRRRNLVILFLGMCGVLPDIDHFINFSVAGSHIPVFHNLYLLMFVPLTLLLISFIVENARGGSSSKYQRFFLALTVILIGHVVLDLLAGNTLYLLFPVETVQYNIEAVGIINGGTLGSIFNLDEMIFCIWLAVAVLSNFLQKWLYNNSEELYVEDQYPMDDLSLPIVITKPIRKEYPS